MPFFPPSLESIDFFIPNRNKFTCHTGTGTFTSSVTVEHYGLILG